MEDYKKKYEEAIFRMNKWVEGSEIIDPKEVAEFVFPELKESEDERIRKHLLKHFRNKTKEQWNEMPTKNIIAWLEKQGEQKPTDKVKPKFKVGDWIVYCNEDVDLITGIEEEGYRINEGGYIPFVCEDDMRIWTIKDAKDGDVLNSTRVKATIIFKGFNHDCKHIDAYCALQSGIFIHQEMLWDRDFDPAPKVWKNNFFAAMKESGYEWDDEKKELKKIKQNPAWSEEDEEEVFIIINFLNNPSTAKLCPTLRSNAIDWLKSLKERVRPQNK